MSLLNQELADLLVDDSFVRWINGNATHTEKEYWNTWLQEDPMHRELKCKAEKMYQYPWELDEGSEVESQLDMLNERIGQVDEKSNLNLVSKNQKANGVRETNRERGYKYAVAAAITLLLAIVSILAMYNWQNSLNEESAPLYTTIEVNKGEIGSLKVSDGSQIRLNSGSSLRYSPEQFNTNRVEVWLKGEGYFDITNNPNGIDRQFIVHTPHGEVSVLGTKFNVNIQPKTTNVVLEQGKVKVSTKDSLGNRKIERTMKPGERAIIAEYSQSISLQEINANLYTSWSKDKMVLSDTPVKEIIDAIEAKYNISIVSKNSDLLGKRMSGSIQNPDLEVLLTGLEQMIELRIEKKDEKKYLITNESLQ